jgi:hypothetical protein
MVCALIYFLSKYLYWCELDGRGKTKAIVYYKCENQ